MDKEQMKLRAKIQRTTLKMLMEPDQQAKHKIQNQLIKLKTKLNK